MSKRFLSVLVCFVLVVLFVAPEAEGRKRRRRKRRPLPTHPVVLWAQTLEESQNLEARQVAAYKMQEYTQPIFRAKTISAILNCMNDDDLQIKVHCTMALRNVKKSTQQTRVRSALLAQYEKEPELRNTVVRTFIFREDADPKVYKRLEKALLESKDSEELVVLLSYFEDQGNGSNDFVNNLVSLYKRKSDDRVRISIAKVLAERASGQSNVLDLFAGCVNSKNTPLVLTCLSGLESQAREDIRAWTAIAKTIKSNDYDVLFASVDVINSLKKTPNMEISTRLVELLDEVEDSELRERIVLAIGVSGDKSQGIVTTLLSTLQDEESPENLRISAALVLGEQAALHSQAPLKGLRSCSRSAKSRSLKTACELGHKELKSVTRSIASTPTKKPVVKSSKLKKKS